MNIHHSPVYPVRIMIAEDQLMTAEGLADILEKTSHFKVLGISPDGEHLLHALNNIQPDMILLDLNMPKMDGLEACRLITQKFPTIRVVILTMYTHAKVPKDARDAGASGMLHKYSSSAELIKKLEEILLTTPKESFITNDNAIPEEPVGPNDQKDVFLLKYKISKREFQIICLIAEGLRTEEIAKNLFLSAHTITTHRKNILNKLNINNSAELIHLMHKSGVLQS